MGNSNPVLLAEDSPEDVFLIRRAFEDNRTPNPLQVVDNGADAFHYLAGEGRFADRATFPFPALFLLDLKMPVMNGFEVLRWIRQQPTLSATRVVVLTGSDHLRDVNQAYQLGANSFMVKPGDFENYIEIGKSLEKYWLHQSKAPETSREPKEREMPSRRTPDEKQS